MPITQHTATAGPERRRGKPAGFALSAEALGLVLAAKGLNVTTAAEVAGIPRGTLAALKGGHDGASAGLALRLADGLGVGAALLFPDFGRGDWLTEEETAAYLGLPRDEVRRLSRLRLLAAEPDTGRRRWFHRAEVDRYATTRGDRR